MNKINLAVIAVLVAIGVVSATAFASTKPSTVSLRKTQAGKVLVGANGRTLYLFTADKAGKSACYGKCASVWPPLIAARPTVGAGLTASMLGTTKRVDGKLQVTYGGHPAVLLRQGQEGRRCSRRGDRPLRRDLVGGLIRRRAAHLVA
jgi:predicted lipoprotein with Yx(FWY)xxD motif